MTTKRNLSSHRFLYLLVLSIPLFLVAGIGPRSAEADIQIMVTPGIHRFPSQIQGTFSPPFEFTISLDESIPAEIKSITSSDPVHFEVLNAPVGLTVPPNRTFHVRFNAIGNPSPNDLIADITVKARRESPTLDTTFIVRVIGRIISETPGGPLACLKLQETITVPVDGSIVTSSTTLEGGIAYKLSASGSFVIGGPGFADAEYAFNSSFSTVVDHCFGLPSEVDFGIGVDDTIVDNVKSPFWGAFDPSHVYVVNLQGLGQPIMLNYHDCFYPDNSGSLTVEIFRLENFDICLQDESNPNTTLLFDSGTGVFRFNCNGFVFTGRGTVTRKGSTVSLTANRLDLRVSAIADTSVSKGTASLQSPPGTNRCTIQDRNLSDNSCICGN